jgi:hypothetical protein
MEDCHEYQTTSEYIDPRLGKCGLGAFASAAEARIGRSLTPMSYAGVARRTTRRAVVYGGAAAAAAAGAYAVTPGCRQVVDAYGRIYTRC